MDILIRANSNRVEDVMRDYDMTYDELAALNNFDLKSLRRGMIVHVRIVDDIEYIVMPFDTIEKIADKFGVSPCYIKEYNGIDKVFLGDTIYLENSRAKGKK